MAANTAAAMTPAVMLPSALVKETAALVPLGDAAVAELLPVVEPAPADVAPAPVDVAPADVTVAVAAVWLSPAEEVWLPPVVLAVEEQTAEVGKFVIPAPAQILSAYLIVAEKEKGNQYHL
jgi:hypothetical protein